MDSGFKFLLNLIELLLFFRVQVKIELSALCVGIRERLKRQSRRQGLAGENRNLDFYLKPRNFQEFFHY